MKVEIVGPWFAAPPVGEEGACNSFLVEAGGSGILLDCGPGTVARLQKRDLGGRIGAIVLSHTHPDHISDLVQLANLRGVMRALEMPEPPPLDLYVPTDDGVETLAALDGVWHERDGEPFGGEFRIIRYTQSDALETEGVEVTFTRTTHARPCYAMRLTDGDSIVVYTADTGYSEDVVAHARGVDLMLCEATLLDPDPRWTEHHGHLTGEMAATMANEAGVSRLVLTHLGPDAGINAENLQRARDICRVPVDIAEAGAVYELP